MRSTCCSTHASSYVRAYWSQPHQLLVLPPGCSKRQPSAVGHCGAKRIMCASAAAPANAGAISVGSLVTVERHEKRRARARADPGGHDRDAAGARPILANDRTTASV